MQKRCYKYKPGQQRKNKKVDIIKKKNGAKYGLQKLIQTTTELNR
jgi:hypothetical protein